MPDDAQAALAAAAAQIAQLQTQLAQATTQISTLNSQIQNLNGQIVSANAATQNAKADTAALQDKYNGDTSALKAEISTQTTRANNAENSRLLLAAKFDAMYGPETDGITRGPQPYIVVQDASSHLNLEAAQIHQIAIKYGIGTAPATMMHKERQHA